MDLEQRIRKLEDELKILKNQIQATLLDIEEQLMGHYYPSLRSSTPEQPDPPPSMRLRERDNVVAPEKEEQAPASVAVRRVRLDEVRGAHAPEPMPTVKAVTMQPAKGGLANMAQLIAWARDTIDTIGAREAAEAIRSFAEEGYLDAETADALQQIIALAPEDDEKREPATMATMLTVLSKLTRIIGQST